MNDSPEDSTPRNASGQSMRRKGQQTRQRLVDATVELLKTESLSTLKAADIAASAGASKPNFYLYFPTVLDAALAAVESVDVDMAPARALLGEPWPDTEVTARAEAFVRAYFRGWAEHAHVLRVRRAMVGEGEPRFAAAEFAAIRPIVDALAAKIADGQRRYPGLRGVHAYSAAGALAAMLERLAGRGPIESNDVGITGPQVIHAIATMIANLLAPPPG